MLRALLLRLARRVQRVGKQKQGCGQIPVFRAQHAGLAAAVGVSPQEDSTLNHPSHYCDRILQTGAVAGGVGGAGWAKGSRLAIGKIAAQHSKAVGGESLGERDQQRRLRVRAGPVGEYEGVAVGSFGRVKEAADLGIDGVVSEVADGGFEHRTILNRAKLVPTFVIGAAALRAGGTGEAPSPHEHRRYSVCSSGTSVSVS